MTKFNCLLTVLSICTLAAACEQKQQSQPSQQEPATPEIKDQPWTKETLARFLHDLDAKLDQKIEIKNGWVIVENWPFGFYAMRQDSVVLKCDLFGISIVTPGNDGESGFGFAEILLGAPWQESDRSLYPNNLDRAASAIACAHVADWISAQISESPAR